MSTKAQNSVLKKEPMNIIEVPDKQIIAVDEKASKENHDTTAMTKDDDKEEMDISMNNDEPLPPNNQK